MSYLNTHNRIMSEPGAAPHENALRWHRENPNHKEYSRLLTAAVVNTNFRNLLLSDPAQAVSAGFCGECFRFSPEEMDRVITIKAATLPEFAEQLLQHRTPVPQYQNY